MLFLITNRKILRKGTLDEVIEKAVSAKVDAIILREKDLCYEKLLLVAKKIQKKIQGKNILFIINSNLEVAKAINADGYHVGFNDFIKRNFNWQGLLGVSVHSLEEAVFAQKQGASYLLASHIFETDCKKGLEPKGIDFIKEMKKNISIPIIALGGIKPENVKQVLSAGAKGVAVMSYIMASIDPYTSAKKLKDMMRKS
ncbi:thiamine phosphate synthase [Crassaminicella thermophila]|uniref:Thiamine-phosphate synthase n=1 Tax=Crassaminicella thermophila TaxID=2599308 RepID=A0A5C0SBW9_CRATE|nr:thiamine phosphate synthase [Crassaminicella thermophila]QEK10998.1 thiamine phosphate synthase [Crassaminicella thermophila]